MKYFKIKKCIVFHMTKIDFLRLEKLKFIR